MPQQARRLTPREFFATTGGYAVPQGPDRQAMKAMMRRFPDG